jgi:hypothetical protein
VVDFELFRLELQPALQRSDRARDSGPPDAVLMFKLLVLQTLYTLSDDQTEYQIRDRLSFVPSSAVALADRVPRRATAASVFGISQRTLCRRLHLQDHGFKFHHGRFLGKPRSSKSRHFGHFGRSGPAFKFGHVPHFKPPHLGHFGDAGLVLKFSDRDVMLRFGHMPHFKHRHFGHRHPHHGLFFGSTSHGSSCRRTIAALHGRTSACVGP